MKKRFLFIALLGAGLSAQAQEQNIRDVFKAMPDSLMPYLSTNNRLDMMDFVDASMKAEVTNLLEGRSEMTALAEDSLVIKLSDALTIRLKLVCQDSAQVVLMRQTYQTLNRQTEVIDKMFTTDWQQISTTVNASSLLRRDEEVR